VAPPPPTLAAALEALARLYGPAHLASDPVRWPRRYGDPGDREVAAVVAALLAYGRVAAIERSVASALAALGPSPSRAVDETPPRDLARRLAGVRHRFTAGEDLAWALVAVGRIRREHGGLGAFLAREAVGPEPLRCALAAWRDRTRRGARGRSPSRERARAFLLPDPRAGGACKRTLLLSRWCLRPDDGVDLGLWRGRLSSRDLIVPLDVHVHRTARSLGLTSRRQADWRAAEEVTAALRCVDPLDPVRFDFALARPGILGRCRHRPFAPGCLPCELRAVCRHGRHVRPPKGPPTR